LPTEAEWEYASAGGDENRKYPWDPSKGDPNSNLAVYDCDFGSTGTPGKCYTDDVAPVGMKPDGAGRWGHLDLAGNMYEWVLDVYDEYPAVGNKDFANTEDVPIRVQRGGSFGSYGDSYLRAASRYYDTPSSRILNVGFRCARGQ
jgi:formylglycine-generating enzyme required for sulfatase activity